MSAVIGFNRCGNLYGRFDTSPAKIRGGMAELNERACLASAMLILTGNPRSESKKVKWTRAAGPLEGVS